MLEEDIAVRRAAIRYHGTFSSVGSVTFRLVIGAGGIGCENWIDWYGILINTRHGPKLQCVLICTVGQTMRPK
jgi:hypothetical protein